MIFTTIVSLGMMAFPGVASALLCGCGVVTVPDLGPDGGAPDSRDPDPANPDAGLVEQDAWAVDSAVTTRCPPPSSFTLSWGTPVKIPLDTGLNEYSPSISCDDRELYFYAVSPDQTDLDIYMTRRSTPAAPWSAPVAVGFGIIDERHPEIGPDVPGGMELYYVRSESVHVARRANPDMPWVEEGKLFDGSVPAITGDGLTLYSIREYQLERRRRASVDAPWDEPESIPLPARYQKLTVSSDGSAFLVFQPVESGAPRVLARRIPDEWLTVPELATMSKCDFTWQGDLLCSGAGDLYYVPNRQN